MSSLCFQKWGKKENLQTDISMRVSARSRKGSWQPGAGGGVLCLQDAQVDLDGVTPSETSSEKDKPYVLSLKHGIGTNEPT